MSDKGSYIQPTVGDGVDIARLNELAPLWETESKRAYEDWIKRNPEPLPGWDGNIWFDRIEARGKRWTEYYRKFVREWWEERGFAVTFDQAGLIAHIDAIPSSTSREPTR